MINNGEKFHERTIVANWVPTCTHDAGVVVNERSGEFIQDWDPGSSAENYVRAALIEARK